MSQMFAELAITDNKEGTLDKVIKLNPWHLEAMKLITGSKERAHLPLREILDEDMGGLILDSTIDVSGVTKGGHFLDTQGYIAHNNDVVVVAFRCTTSIFDWMTNFNSSTSAWELEEDLAQGFSGFCSGMDGLCCQGSAYTPRVHTGFYNNLLAALPTIKRHVDQYLFSYERPRKLYIVGHSLGAGIANLTALYFLLEYNWKLLPQNLILVTAGSPRSICTSMKELVDQKLALYGPKKVRFHRVVRGSDVVASVPPKVLGFAHVADPIVITDEGNVVLRTKDADAETDLGQLFSLTKDSGSVRTLGVEGRNDEDDYETSDDSTHSDSEDVEQAKYNRMVARIPKAVRDHMPDFYLKPIFKRQGIKCGTLRQVEDPDSHDNSGNFPVNEPITTTTDDATKVAMSTKEPDKKGRRWVPKMFRKERSSPKVELPSF